MAGIILGFILLAIVEIGSLFITAKYISTINTISLIMFTLLVGVILGRSYHGGYLDKVKWHLRSREPAPEEVIDGAVMVMGSKLLMTPGVITDVIGLFMTIPKIRAIARAITRNFINKRMAEGKNYFFFKD